MLAGGQACSAADPDDNPQYGEKHDVDQGTRGDAPERGAWAGQRINLGDAYCRCAEAPAASSRNLAAGQGMAEFVNQYDQKQAQILGDIPCDRGIPLPSTLDLIDGDQKPRPM